MFIKTIIQGRLEFGNERSYDQVVKMFEYRTETYYKNDILIKQEEVFNPDKYSLEIPRYVGQHLSKTFKNTVSLLHYCAQFALSGEVRVWQTDTGVILNYSYIEPKNDKLAVINFQKGKELLDKKGNYEEAMISLTKAIENYNRHAQAYRKRGEVNFRLKNYHDAKRDFAKALKIDGTIPDAYMGLANIAIIKKEDQEAVDNLEKVLKYSVALQDIYWKARRLKGEAHLRLKQYEKAEFDFKLFSNRKFKKEDPNYSWQRQVSLLYAKSLVLQEKNKEAFDLIKVIEKNDQECPYFNEAEFFLLRGMVKENLGKNGFKKDYKEASELGNEFATARLGR